MHRYLAIILVATAIGASGCGDDDTGDDDGNGNAGDGEAGNSGSGGDDSASGTGGKTGTSGTGGKTGTGGKGSSGTGGATGSGGATTEPDAGQAGGDIVETALAAGSFTKLAGALTTAGLVEALKGDGPFTVFAPHDAAFAAFEKKNPGVLAGLTKAQLTDILQYHVISGAAVEAKDLKDGQVAATLLGPVVAIDLSGEQPKVNDANVIAADVEADNGVIHVIDTILLPPDKDIVETAIAAGTFTALAGALTDAELVDALKGEGPFTVFAPTDDAFGELAAVPTGDDLKNVLLYHVVSGAIGAGDLKDGDVETLLEGESLTIDLSSGVKVNDAKVITANIIATNGVIHVIDKVLVPE